MTRHDLNPDMLEEVDPPGALIMLVEAGLGVTILASNMMEEYSNLEHLHLAELDTLSSSSHLLAAWDQTSANPCLPQFVDELHRIRKSRG